MCMVQIMLELILYHPYKSSVLFLNLNATVSLRANYDQQFSLFHHLKFCF